MDREEEKELGSFREEIDSTDREIIRLILRRTEFAEKIGRAKRAHGLPVYRPDREREVLENVVRIAHELEGRPALSDETLRNIYREIMSGSIAAESGPAIAFMGPAASFSHLACRTRFGSSIREVAVDSIPEVFRTVASGREASYGVVPVDNTTEGSVGITLDLLLQYNLTVYAELYIRVNHNLLYHEKIECKDIKRLYTNKIVKEQCRNWIQGHLPTSGMEIVDMVSSAAAARIAAERKDGAAIASDIAAQEYQLQVIEKEIQDSTDNITRFLIIGHDQCPPSGDDKTSIICSLPDSPGSLFRMLQPFHEHNINLTRIESRASRISYGDYNFFIDFLGHHLDPEIAEILRITASNTAFLKILGSYPRTKRP